MDGDKKASLGGNQQAEDMQALHRLVRMLAGRCVRPQDRDDVTQRVLVRMIPLLSKVSTEDLRRLSHRLVRWEVLRFLSTERKVRLTVQLDSLPESMRAAKDGGSDSSPPTQEELDRLVLQYDFPPAQHRVLVACLSGARGILEIGKAASVRPDTVRTILRRLLKRLKE